jgi:hypothetical protein
VKHEKAILFLFGQNLHKNSNDSCRRTTDAFQHILPEKTNYSKLSTKHDQNSKSRFNVDICEQLCVAVIQLLQRRRQNEIQTTAIYTSTS